MRPSATSSPKEEPNGLEDSINGAPVKRPHSPTEEDLAKRHKDVSRALSAHGFVFKQFNCSRFHLVLFPLQVVSSDNTAFKEPYPPSSNCYPHGDGASVVGFLFFSVSVRFLGDLLQGGNYFKELPLSYGQMREVVSHVQYYCGSYHLVRSLLSAVLCTGTPGIFVSH